MNSAHVSSTGWPSNSSIDLLLDLQGLHKEADGLINATVVSPLGSEVFRVRQPTELARLFNEWLRNYTVLHDVNIQRNRSTGVTADGESQKARLLLDRLQEWLNEPEWEPLQTLLQELPELPLRLRITPAGSQLARWPWEGLPLHRPIWRLASIRPTITPPQKRPVRKPRLLVLLGQTAGREDTEQITLDFKQELWHLERLNLQGGLAIKILAANVNSRAELLGQLRDPLGWDGLLFMGHSKADTRSGGLCLADGSWLSGADLAESLRQSAGGCPAFVVLNSCSGLELAEACITAGVEWAIAFRERVPDKAASFALRSLLGELQAHGDLAMAVTQTRQAFKAAPKSNFDQHQLAGCHLLLSAVCADTAAPLCLPLTRKRHFFGRLSRATGSQAFIAAATVFLGLGMDLIPANPLSTWLLDGRLEAQRLWRQGTGNLGPKGRALPLLLLRNNQLKADFGVQPLNDRLSSQALTEVLRRAPNPAVPVVALDVILDDPKPDPIALAQTISRQQPRKVFAGFPPGTSAVDGAGTALPIKLLQNSGLTAYAIDVGTSGERGSDNLQPVPLQLTQSQVGSHTFAAAVARSLAPRLASPALPLHAVIDWSIQWRALLTFQRADGLSSLRAPVLLVGSDGSQTREPRDRDLFQTPRALAGALAGARERESGEWGTLQVKLPGVVLQAVLAQSMALGHWLTPWATGPTSALAAGLGVLGAAAIPSRRWRALGWLVVSAIAVPLSLQAAVTTKTLVPLTLPLLACGATALAGIGRSPVRGKRRGTTEGAWATSGAADRRG
ncbi:MAG: CHAT domain-containing protein [Cyanobacteriota bacterium]